MNYQDQRELIRRVIAQASGLPLEKIKLDESGKHADLAWRIPQELCE